MDQDPVPALPPGLRFLRALVILLTLTMIVGVITVVGLLVTRIPAGFGAAGPAGRLPAAIVLPAGTTAAAATFGSGWIALVLTAGDGAQRIAVYAPDGRLLQEVALPPAGP
jgi:hypothetical protein